ncbi:MAG TPA: nuclear transport factor 2 family protein [Solirubrobacterales bacterium]|nr:nuclear transport factor 2 family protein [Solirubrobacterales bacterium]
MRREIDAGPRGLDVEFLDEWSSRWLAAWNAQEVDAIVAMCDEDLELDDPALPAALHGKDGIRAFAVDTFATFPDLRLEALEPPCPSRRGAGAWFPYRMTGTMSGHWGPLDIAPTGASIDFRGVTEWRFRGALLVLWDTVYDNLEGARQMGIVPRQGSRGDRLFSKLQHLRAPAQRRANA